MNTAYLLAIIWGLLAVLSLLFVNGENGKLALTFSIAAVVSALIGVAIQYGLLS